MVLPPEIGELDLRFRNLLKERVTGVHAAEVEKLNAAYLGGVARAIASEQSAGRLDGVLALEAEKKRVEDKEPMPPSDEEGILPGLAELRKVYRGQQGKLETVRAANLKALVDPMEARLAQMETEFTRAGSLDKAKAVRVYRLELGEEIKALGFLSAASAPEEARRPSGPLGAAGDLEGKEPGEARRIGEVEMVWCPAGSFTMGSPESEAGRQNDEEPVKVRLGSGFWLARTETPQKLWERTMGSNPSYYQGADRPVERVSWTDAQAFVDRLNELAPLAEGWKWSLPTEAQWEYACRAGTETAYSGGEALDGTKAKVKGVGAAETAPVGEDKANEWGLHDMHGNVREWCLDWHSAKLPGGTDPTGAGSGTVRVRRGGSWNHEPASCRSASRHKGPPEDRNSDLGVRLAVVRADP